MSDTASTSTQTVASSAVLVATLFAVDKVLGVVRDAAISRAFGASAALDAYYAAFELPDALFNVIAGLALSTALIPVLAAHTRRGEAGRAEAWRLASTVINWALLLITVAGIVAAVFAREVIIAVAPGFEPERVSLATGLMRLVLLQTVLASISGIVMSVLHAHQHFLLPAAAPIAYTLGRIGGALLLAPRFGIYGLALGGLAGTVGHFLVQVPGLIRFGARWSPKLHHSDLATILRLMGPRVLGLGATYISFVLPTYFGSRLAAGAISSYEYAWRLMQFPETIIGTALGLTVFPTLAQQADVGDRQGMRKTAGWALRLMMALAIPAAVGLLVLGQPLTALFLQRGAFDAAATARVYRALQAFALGLITHSALEVLSRLFYAQRDMWTPLWAAIAGLGANLLLSQLLLNQLEHVGLALANSIGVGVQVGILQAVARRRLRPAATDVAAPSGGAGTGFAASIARSLLVSALMGGAILAFRHSQPGARLPMAAIGGVMVGGSTFLVAAALFGPQELRDLSRQLMGKLGSQASGAGQSNVGRPDAESSDA